VIASLGTSIEKHGQALMDITKIDANKKEKDRLGLQCSYTVLSYTFFKYALSLNNTSPSTNKPFSTHVCKLLASKARQSDDNPQYMIKMSRICPQTSLTAWQLRPNLFFLPHRNFFWPTPAVFASFIDGLCIQIKILSIAPVQQSNLTLLASQNPFAILFCSATSIYCFNNYPDTLKNRGV
jgi:hypothetical protein